MNAYCTTSALLALDAFAGFSVSQALSAILATSREIEGAAMANRLFYVRNASRHYDVRCGQYERIPIDDLLSATAVTIDDDGDGTYGETLTEGTHFEFLPEFTFPRRWLRVFPWNDTTLPHGTRRVRIVGTWGYGDGQSADPWLTSGVTGTLASVDGTSLTLSASGTVEPGHTLLLGSEQMFVSAVSSTTATVRRGVNGTTASTHAAVAVRLAQYPADIVAACLHLSAARLGDQSAAGVTEQRTGQYTEKRAPISDAMRRRLVLAHRRIGYV